MSRNAPTQIGVTAPDYDLTAASDVDYAGAFAGIAPEVREHQLAVRQFVQDEVLPVIDGYWERAEVPFDLVKGLAERDFLRDGVDVPGRPTVSLMAEGLASMEMSRGDGSVATVCGVQGGLALRSIVMHGSPEQIEQYAEPMARGEILGAFALTEPTHGSDSVSLETTAERTVRDGVEGYVINGEKKWIGFGSCGHITVVWARLVGDDGDNQVHGFIVPQDAPGYTGTTIEGKMSLRAIWQAHIVLDDVFVPADAALPGATSFKATSEVLFATRLSVAWAAVGHAIACYESALAYSTQRVQFGKPLAARQMVQERLTRMLSTVTQLQLLVARLTELAEKGELTGEQASLAKYTCTRGAREVASIARDMLGGNGILLANRVARHFADIEALHTYEGTESMNALIIGRDITGVSAFA
ncbi:MULTISPECIES: acyl-CoA dehydrogenase family protein [Isoptericola]|uniref:Acyl-CoA dehydrogenase n=1 Tax=Isoptericola sediminis TaxID=2733572 RepID=A0A849K1M8_9MICO|nr:MULTISPECIES: acyl-CoA dehydrogenase family protein [Isoptericola]MDO8145617.1 acyl-CoA dehydrogenase family protein [Isoptericola sp. 178]MDO8149187.1 acyl-CoA dehydrogenase family protein [Isoptericola sp. b515]MDO8152126.1 acyl-CoA dehydrogenase family protein [Isoptericola sp. b408]NNU26160.1 acyl-CoA dehydrogenase [Isoptericola sediminis]